MCLRYKEMSLFESTLSLSTILIILECMHSSECVYTFCTGPCSSLPLSVLARLLLLLLTLWVNCRLSVEVAV